MAGSSAATAGTALPAVSPQIELLLTALTEQVAVDPAELPGAQAMADLDGLLEAQRLLQRVLLRRVADADTRALAPLVDAPTVSAWLRAQDAPVAPDAVATARRLSRHGAVEAAVLDGRLSVPAASLIAKVLADLRPVLDRPDGLLDGQPAEPVVQAVIVDGVPDQVCSALGGLGDGDPRVLELHHQLSEVACWPTPQLDRLEHAFLLLAQALPPGLPLLRSALSMLVDALRPQQLEDAADKAHADRGLVLTPNPGRPGGHVCGDLDAECFELLHTVLTACAEADPDNPRDTEAWAAARAAGWELGDPMPAGLQAELDSPCLTVRSARQRLHDALRLGLTALLDSAALGKRGKTAPHIGVTVPLAALNGDAGCAASDRQQPASTCRSRS